MTNRAERAAQPSRADSAGVWRESSSGERTEEPWSSLVSRRGIGRAHQDCGALRHGRDVPRRKSRLFERISQRHRLTVTEVTKKGKLIQSAAVRRRVERSNRAQGRIRTTSHHCRGCGVTNVDIARCRISGATGPVFG